MVELSEPGVWLDQARADLEHARRSLDLEHHEWACYAAQQSAEKCLKAVLLAAGAKPHFTHHLNVLAGQIAEIGIEVAGLPSKKRLVDLSDKNLLARYPLSGAEAPHKTLTREHGEEAVQTAAEVVAYGERMIAPGP